MFVAAGLAGLAARAADYPQPQEADYVIRDFRFACGESLPELRVHYRVLGRPDRGADGMVRNAVIILHGTGGSGANFIRPEFAGELFGIEQIELLPERGLGTALGFERRVAAGTAEKVEKSAGGVAVRDLLGACA